MTELPKPIMTRMKNGAERVWLFPSFRSFNASPVRTFGTPLGLKFHFAVFRQIPASTPSHASRAGACGGRSETKRSFRNKPVPKCNFGTREPPVRPSVHEHERGRRASACGPLRFLHFLHPWRLTRFLWPLVGFPHFLYKYASILKP